MQFLPDDDGEYTDANTNPFDELHPAAEDGMVDEFEAIALSIDPSRDALYDYTMNMLQDIAGANEHDRAQDYTYFDLPALAASPNNFEEFD